MQCVKPFLLKTTEGQIIEMPCGNCLACKIQRSREWAMRLLHELEYWEKATFITLTYAPEHLPEKSSLKPDDLQKFWKRLRKELKDKKIKYFACGEYGEKEDKTHRPHYHAIVFGLGPEDEKLISEIWAMGNVFAGTVTYDSCRYVCDYIMKKYNSKKEKEIYADTGRKNPYKTCSQGLGLRFALDNRDSLEEDQGLTVRGVPCGVPRYYRKKLDMGPANMLEHSLEKHRETEEFYRERGCSDAYQVLQAIRASRDQRYEDLISKNNMKRRVKI